MATESIQRTSYSVHINANLVGVVVFVVVFVARWSSHTHVAIANVTFVVKAVTAPVGPSRAEHST